MADVAATQYVFPMAEETGSSVKHLLSTGEVAVQLGISPRTVLHRVHTGAIPVIGQFGVQKQFVFDAETIEHIKHP